jgi:hypothetical protein
MPSSFHSPRTSSTGTTAAPVTTSRRVSSSKEARSGWSRIDWKMVGGPGSTEIRCWPIRATTPSTSKTGSGTMVAPVIRQARMPAL